MEKTNSTFSWVTCRNFGPCGYQVEKKLKMAGINHKPANWAFLISLLALVTMFQQNYHNHQMVATPTEIVGLYCVIPTERAAANFF